MPGWSEAEMANTTKTGNTQWKGLYWRVGSAWPDLMEEHFLTVKTYLTFGQSALGSARNTTDRFESHSQPGAGYCWCGRNQSGQRLSSHEDFHPIRRLLFETVIR